DQSEMLTPREREILQLLADGLSNGDVAERLFISQETVKSHVRHILTKLEADTGTQAVAIALREPMMDCGWGNPGFPAGDRESSDGKPRRARAIDCRGAGRAAAAGAVPARRAGAAALRDRADARRRPPLALRRGA